MTAPRQDVDTRPDEEPELGDALLPDGRVLFLRWQRIQGRFVDEPRAAVEEADALVNEVVGQLTDAFEDQRDRLEHQWKTGDEASTEDLRQALQRYRSFFERLVAV